MAYQFDHISLFVQQNTERQLTLLANFVLEIKTVIVVDVDKFDDRLARYAEKAGLDNHVARDNVAARCKELLSNRLHAFGL